MAEQMCKYGFGCTRDVYILLMGTAWEMCLPLGSSVVLNLRVEF